MRNVYWHEPTKKLVVLKTFIGENKLNTFIECDLNGNPIKCKRGWSEKPSVEQEFLIRGYSNLKHIN